MRRLFQFPLQWSALLLRAVASTLLRISNSLGAERDAEEKAHAPAEGSPASTSVEQPDPFRRSGPPAHWVERVRQGAPGLLEKGGQLVTTPQIPGKGSIQSWAKRPVAQTPGDRPVQTAKRLPKDSNIAASAQKSGSALKEQWVSAETPVAPKQPPKAVRLFVPPPARHPGSAGTEPVAKPLRKKIPSSIFDQHVPGTSTGHSPMGLAKNEPPGIPRNNRNREDVQPPEPPRRVKNLAPRAEEFSTGVPPAPGGEAIGSIRAERPGSRSVSRERFHFLGPVQKPGSGVRNTAVRVAPTPTARNSKQTSPPISQRDSAAPVRLRNPAASKSTPERGGNEEESASADRWPELPRESKPREDDLQEWIRSREREHKLNQEQSGSPWNA